MTSLLEAASAGIYRPLWSSEILTELDRALRVLQVKRGMAAKETEAYLVRLFRQMETSFPDALVTDWESLIDAVHLPDPGDRHVVAAARAGRADVIVTDNVADFPPGALPAPLIRKSLDEFLIDSLDLYPARSSARSTLSPGEPADPGRPLTRRLPPDRSCRTATTRSAAGRVTRCHYSELHSALGYLSPAEYESTHHNATRPAA